MSKSDHLYEIPCEVCHTPRHPVYLQSSIHSGYAIKHCFDEDGCIHGAKIIAALRASKNQKERLFLESFRGQHKERNILNEINENINDISVFLEDVNEQTIENNSLIKDLIEKVDSLKLCSCKRGA